MMNQEDIDLLQRHLDGTIGDDEFQRLQTLLRENAEARRMLRDLSTVAVKLHELAAAGPGNAAMLPMPSSRPVWRQSRTLAAAAACAALVLTATEFFLHRPARTQPDPAQTFASVRNAIARLPAPPVASFPEWISPTDSMLRSKDSPL